MGSTVRVGLAIALGLGGCSFEGQGIDQARPDAAELGADGSLARACEDDPALALCLRFEESSGTPVARDESTYRNDASILRVTSVPRFASRAVMVSAESTIRVPESAALDAATGVSLDLWIAPTEPPTADNAWIVDNYRQYAMTYRDDGRIRCVIGDRTVDSTTRIAPGSGWHHVACVYDGAVIQVFVDGRVEGCKVIADDLSIDGTLGTSIGSKIAGGLASHFVGGIDDVRIYQRSLAAAEICGHAGVDSCSPICPGASDPQ